MRKDFSTRTPYEIGISSSANNIIKYTGINTLCQPSTPIAVRAYLIYNKLIRDGKMTNKYNAVQDGDKIKYVHLKIPNIASQNVFGFLGKWPEELSLTNDIDYDTMYDKTFINPMKNILDVIGWKTEYTNILERFFL